MTKEEIDSVYRAMQRVQDTIRIRERATKLEFKWRISNKNPNNADFAFSSDNFDDFVKFARINWGDKTEKEMEGHLNVNACDENLDKNAKMYLSVSFISAQA